MKLKNKIFFFVLFILFIFNGFFLFSQNCDIFPKNNIWNTPIDNLPVHSNSNLYINTIGANTGLHPDFGSGTWNGAPIGIPFIYVNGNQPKVNVTFNYTVVGDLGEFVAEFYAKRDQAVPSVS